MVFIRWSLDFLTYSSSKIITWAKCEARKKGRNSAIPVFHGGLWKLIPNPSESGKLDGSTNTMKIPLKHWCFCCVYTLVIYVIETVHQKEPSQEMPSGNVTSRIMVRKRGMWRHLALDTVGLLLFCCFFFVWLEFFFKGYSVKLLPSQKEGFCHFFNLRFLVSLLSLNKTSVWFLLVK